MNRDDIIRMAMESGIKIAGPMDTIDYRNVYGHELERFAALVAAAEREACAKVCEKEAGELNTVRESLAAVTCAAAIRARGEK